MSLTDTTTITRAVAAGIDWAQADHALCVIDGDGAPIERVTVASQPRQHKTRPQPAHHTSRKVS